jgi:hypothetical protein
MKYMLLNDFNALKKQRKIIIAYTICLIIFCLCMLKINEQIDVENINLKSLGMIFSFNYIDILMYALNYLYYLYIIISIFLSNINCSGQNIFSRVTKKKYFIYKLISILLIILISKIIYHILICIICNINLNFITLLIDYNYTISIGLLLIILFIFYCVKKNIFITMLIILLCIIFCNTNILSSINIPLYALIISNIILIIILIYLSKFLFNIYERND